MMKRVFPAGVCAAGVFVVSGWVLTRSLRFSDPESRGGVQSALLQLGTFVDEIIEKEGARPKEKGVNDAIETAFEGGAQEVPLDSPLSRLAKKIARDPDLGSLSSPPVFAEKNDLPNGFGFYWRGEDGLSNSGGMDPDDINTWVSGSDQFYEDRTSRTIMLQYSGLAMVPTLITFAFLIRLTGKKSFRDRLAWLVKKAFLWIGIPSGLLAIFCLVSLVAIFGFPLSRSGNFTPSWKSELPSTATEVYEKGSGEALIGDYNYLLRARVTEEEFIDFCERLELTLHTEEREYEDDASYGVSWHGYPAACGGWWVPRDSVEETFVRQEGHTWALAKYEGGHLYFKSFKH